MATKARSLARILRHERAGVRGNLSAVGTAQQPVDWLASGLAAQIPQREIDRADGMDDSTSPTVDGGVPVHLVPDSLVIERVLTQHKVTQPLCVDVRRWGLDDRFKNRRRCVRLAHTGESLVGTHLHD